MEKKISIGLAVTLILSSLLIGVFNSYIYAEQPAQDKVIGWKNWVNNISGYMDKIKELRNKSQRIAEEAGKALGEALQKNDDKLGKAIMTEATNKYSVLSKELKKLTPPKDLENYHKKMIEVFGYEEKLSYIASRGDESPRKFYNNMLIKSSIEATEELKRVCIEHGAPKDTIDGYNMLIELQKKLLIER